MSRHAPLVLVVVTTLVVSLLAPAGVFALDVGPGGTTGDVDGASATSGNVTASSDRQASDATVDASSGRMLSTVVATTSEQVRSKVGDSMFQASLSNGDAERAAAIADRATSLESRAAAIAADYRDAVAAYNDGDLTRDEFAQRIATLNARAEALVESFDSLERKMNSVSTLQLRAAGVNRTELAGSIADVESVSGTGASALRQRLTGQRAGEIRLSTDGGLRIEVVDRDGNVSREIERHDDDDSSVLVNQSTALSTARDALSPPPGGNWVLTSGGIDRKQGVYEFGFTLRSNDGIGEASVTVDGSSGTVVDLEEEINRVVPDAADHGDDGPGGSDESGGDGSGGSDESGGDGPGGSNESSDDATVDEIALIVDSGTVEPGATITVVALSEQGGVPNATMYRDGTRIGRTGPNGTYTVTLPDSGQVELVARSGDARGELQFDLGPAENEREARGEDLLSITSELDGGTITTDVRYRGIPVEDMEVRVGGRTVAETGYDGTARFGYGGEANGAFRMTFVLGKFTTQRTYVVENGSLIPESEASDGGGADGGDGAADEPIDKLVLVVDSGTVEPGATLTVVALSERGPVSNATMYRNGSRVGHTGPNGTFTVTLPDDGVVELTARAGDGEDGLTFDLGGNESDGADDGLDTAPLSISTELDGKTVVTEVRYSGVPVENMWILVGNSKVADTGPDGVARFDVDPDATDRLAMTFALDQFATERVYVIENGSLIPADRADDGTDGNGDGDNGDGDSGDGGDGTDGGDGPPKLVDPAISATMNGGQVTTSVRQDGRPIEDVSVSLHGTDLGETSSNGKLTFGFTPGTVDEIGLTFVKGDFRTERVYVVENGSLILEEEVDDGSNGSGSDDDSLDDGNTTDGNTTDGGLDDGNTTDDSLDDGNTTDGGLDDGNTTDSSLDDGNTTDGNTTDDSLDDGNTTDGNTTDDSLDDGNTTDGNATRLTAPSTLSSISRDAGGAAIRGTSWGASKDLRVATSGRV